MCKRRSRERKSEIRRSKSEGRPKPEFRRSYEAFAGFLHLFDNSRRGRGHDWGMKMTYRWLLADSGRAIAFAGLIAAFAARGETNNIPNRLIDYDTFLAHASEVGRLRAEHRVTEDRFLEMATQAGTIVFDARSDDKYQKLHIKGARHLSFPEITEIELAKIFPRKSTRILIYCN